MSILAVRAAQVMASSLARGLEQWQIDHEKVKICWEVEDCLRLVNDAFGTMFRIAKRWDPDECDSDDSGDEEDERTIEEMYRHILGSIDKIFGVVQAIEKDNYTLEGAGTFRDNRARLKSIVAEIDRLAAAEVRMGYRGVTVSPDAVEAVRAMINDRGSSPTPSA